jgi:hypothetical protein
MPAVTQMESILTFPARNTRGTACANTTPAPDHCTAKPIPIEPPDGDDDRRYESIRILISDQHQNIQVIV